MASRSESLPSRFPVGTKFVIESRGGGAVSRYLEFPDGTHIALPMRPPARKPRAAKRRLPRVSRRRA